MTRRHHAEARRPLFDRLVDEAPWRRHDLAEGPEGNRTVHRALDREGLLESVRLELERLFATRSPLLAHQLEDPQRERTVLDYGLPDLGSFAAANSEDRQRLAAILRSTVAAYEPRLEQVAVTVDPIPERPRAVAIHIGGEVRIDRIPEPVWFPVILEGGRTRVQAAISTEEPTVAGR
jgi:type VI secretion system lysozyme-like protein